MARRADFSFRGWQYTRHYGTNTHAVWECGSGSPDHPNRSIFILHDKGGKWRLVDRSTHREDVLSEHTTLKGAQVAWKILRGTHNA